MAFVHENEPFHNFITCSFSQLDSLLALISERVLLFFLRVLACLPPFTLVEKHKPFLRMMLKVTES